MDYISRSEIERMAQAMLGRPAIISLYGPLGVGKTTLLERFEEIAERQTSAEVVYADLKKGLAQALYSFEEKSSFNTIEEEAACYTLKVLAEQLVAKKTLTLVHRRRELGIKAASNTDIRTLLAKAGGQAVSVISNTLIRGFTPLPVIANLLGATSEIANNTQLVNSFVELVTQHKREQHVKLLVNPKKTLTDAFVEDLIASEKDQFIFLLDDVRSDLDILTDWLRDLMKRLTIDLQITWVLVSWRKIRKDKWQDLDLEFLPMKVSRWELHILQEQMVNDIWRTLRHFPSPSLEPRMRYIALGPVVEKQRLIGSTKKRGKGLSFLPLLISGAAKQSNSDQNCCKSLSVSFREWLTDDELFEHIRQLAVTRWFDRKIAKHLLGPSTDTEIWERLLSVGKGRFIEQEGMKRYIQPELRYALLRYTQVHYSMEDYYALHRPLIAFYQEKIIRWQSHSSETSVRHHSSYDRGIHRLLKKVDRNSQAHSKVLVYQQRLRHNLDRSDQYGSTPARKSGLFEILDQLNSLSLRFMGVPFQELCLAPPLDGSWAKNLKPGILLSHPQPRSYYVEWCYHTFSACANPGLALLDVFQRALFGRFVAQEVGPLISAIYQVADERHAELDFLTNPIRLLSLPVTEIGRQDKEPKSYKKKFRIWGKKLEECLDEFENLPYEINWNNIIDFFKAIIELHELNSKCLFPEAVVEAVYWLAVATYETKEIYEICGENWTEMKCLQEIINLSEDYEGAWWQDTEELARNGLQVFQEGKNWDWEEWL